MPQCAVRTMYSTGNWVRCVSKYGHASGHLFETPEDRLPLHASEIGLEVLKANLGKQVHADTEVTITGPGWTVTGICVGEHAYSPASDGCCGHDELSECHVSKCPCEVKDRHEKCRACTSFGRHSPTCYLCPVKAEKPKCELPCDMTDCHLSEGECHWPDCQACGTSS